MKKPSEQIPAWKKFVKYVYDSDTNNYFYPSELIKTKVVADRKALHNMIYRLYKNGYIEWTSFPSAYPDGIFYKIKLTDKGLDVARSFTTESSVVKNPCKPAFEMAVNGNVVLSLSYNDAYAVLDAVKTIYEKVFKQFENR